MDIKKVINQSTVCHKVKMRTFMLNGRAIGVAPIFHAEEVLIFVDGEPYETLFFNDTESDE